MFDVRIHVDMDVCESHGQCVFAAPEVFSFDDDDRLRYEAEPAAGLREDVVRAAGACPVRAIALVGEAG
ncbi:ferredoxin [Saccharothrix coeruleofusca]|uniref:ferredoxin n=1 Tax=Saccharothrix coeruleofusca TaxID=33919 RepID=UPI0027DD3C1D|nr:ferredoxin [Saccharothrix coeruleofusca]MBP2336185.1 ferredoxin [Saccharothrix coeruleofusca]